MRRHLIILFALLPWSCFPSGRGYVARDWSTPEDAHISLPGDGPSGSGDLRQTGCAQADYAATQAPAALLVVLDRSSSMADNNKYSYAAQAIVSALDQDIFNSMSVGLMAAPSGDVASPPCISFIVPQVACQAPPFPQINIQPAGTLKSGDVSGVRHDIKQWLAGNSPATGEGDATPVYNALQSGLLALQSWNPPGGSGKRILLLVTDGTISCNQFSNRPGFPDCNGCTHDWEDPSNIVKLLAIAHSDPQKPVDTFIVGVPGADTFDAQGCNYPPYHMRLALSAIAYAGSPNNVPATCTGKTFTKGGGDPAVSCHVDLTQGNFNAPALSNTISIARGKVLGCIFNLPSVDMGVIDRGQVNVNYTLNGMVVDLFRRKDPNNQCTQTGCWDYTSDGRVQLIGKACDDVSMQPNVSVKIIVGCQTTIG